MYTGDESANALFEKTMNLNISEMMSFIASDKYYMILDTFIAPHPARLVRFNKARSDVLISLRSTYG